MSTTNNNEAKLKKCPFCGNEARLDFSGDGNKPYFDYDGDLANTPFTYTVFCESCSCKIANYSDPKMAIKAWNGRVDND